MVIRVGVDGNLSPFELLPELFLGRSVRQLLSNGVKDDFLAACGEVARTRAARVFVPDGYGETDEVMITPILDDHRQRCQFLIVWARNNGEGPYAVANDANARWSALQVDQVQVRYRAIETNQIEAAPWWTVGRGVDLWSHSHRVSSVGLATAVMTELVAESVSALSGHDDIKMRIGVPAKEMLPGLVPTCHGVVRSAGVAPERIVLAIPVEVAVDPDLLPVLVHLRTLGCQIDIVGLDALTTKLHRVSDTAAPYLAKRPTPVRSATGDWTADIGRAVSDAAQL